jgi:DNA repair exonuclease SbcCD ATPase subunit
MRSTIRINKEEYDELREYRFKALFCKPPVPVVCSSRDDENIRLKKSLIDLKNQLAEKLEEGIMWRDDGIKDLEDEIDKKNEEIEYLKGEVENQRETIKRLSQQLTENELYEKKKKENAPTGVPAIDATMDRLIRLEAKYEAHQNPYFF